MTLFTHITDKEMLRVIDFGCKSIHQDEVTWGEEMPKDSWHIELGLQTAAHSLVFVWTEWIYHHKFMAVYGWFFFPTFWGYCHAYIREFPFITQEMGFSWEFAAMSSSGFSHRRSAAEAIFFWLRPVHTENGSIIPIISVISTTSIIQYL